MIIDSVVDDVTKVIGTASTVITLLLVWKKALPKIEQIHQQTNGLAIKAEAGAHALGVQEGLRQSSEVDPAVAAAAKLVLEAAAERAAVVLATAAENAKGK